MTRLKVNDRAIIRTPNRFVRCGYPVSHSMAVEQITKTKKAEILNFIKSMGWSDHRYLTSPEFGLDFGKPDLHLNTENKSLSKLLSALGFMEINQSGFGGKKRSIHTVRDDDLLDVYAVVREMKMVVTGTYYSPWSGTTYEGEHDYEPGGLANQKHHRIYRVDVCNYTVRYSTNDIPHQTWHGLWFEEQCLERITNEKE